MTPGAVPIRRIGRGLLKDVGDSPGQLKHVLDGEPLAPEPLVGRTTQRRTVLSHLLRRGQGGREVQEAGVDVGQLRHPVNRECFGVQRRQMVSVVPQGDLPGPLLGPGPRALVRAAVLRYTASAPQGL